jgi:hypothetical protein
VTTPEKVPDGRVIITREPAYITVAFGKTIDNPKPANGINQLLLDDESVVFECAEGDYINPDIERVIRHRPKHSPSAQKYTPETVAKVMEYWHRERAVSVRGVNERTANRLNSDRVPTPTGVQWFASTVASLAQRHKDEHKAPADHVPAPFPQPAPVPQAKADTIAAGEAADKIKELVEWLVSAVASAESRCDHGDYDELKEKASMFDQMRTFMGKGE